MKIVMLDRNSLGMDIDISIFKKLGKFEAYDVLQKEKVKEVIGDADVVIFNKTIMNEELLKDAKNIKLLCITATGTDNIDIAYTDSRGITVTNIKGYSRPAVVQHTFALALFVLEKLRFYDDYVKSGEYSKQLGFSNFSQRYWELEGKTWGIIGLGDIGRSVAKVAESFGCHIIYYSASGKNNSTEFQRVEFKELVTQSDIISIHCPLTNLTKGLMDKKAFSSMKKTAILVNVARGPIINEDDLYWALEDEQIAGAGLDVLSKEPMEKDNPLYQIKDSNKLIITPHMAWASIEARNRCIDEVYKNIESYQEGDIRNVVTLS